MGCRSQALKPARVITRPRHSLRMAEVEEGNSPSLPEGMVEISREELKALAEQAGVNVKTTSELVKEERIKVVQGREGGREEAGRELAHFQRVHRFLVAPSRSLSTHRTAQRPSGRRAASVSGLKILVYEALSY